MTSLILASTVLQFIVKCVSALLQAFRSSRRRSSFNIFFRGPEYFFSSIFSYSCVFLIKKKSFAMICSPSEKPSPSFQAWLLSQRFFPHSHWLSLKKYPFFPHTLQSFPLISVHLHPSFLPASLFLPYLPFSPLSRTLFSSLVISPPAFYLSLFGLRLSKTNHSLCFRPCALMSFTNMPVLILQQQVVKPLSFR